MPLPPDYPALVYARLFACASSAVAAYNAAVIADQAAEPPGPLAGCRPVTVNKGLLDFRASGRVDGGTAGGDVASYPRFWITLTGGSQPAPRMTTFGFIGSVAGADAVLPHTVAWTEVVEHDPAATADALTTPLEAFIDAAFDAAQPKLAVPSATPPLAALTCLRQFSRTHVRRDGAGTAGGTQTTRRTTGTAEMWPHRND